MAVSVSSSTQRIGQEISLPPTRKFHLVSQGSPLFRDLTQIFNRVLVPLYGSQRDALEKIKNGTDRVCYLLCEEETPVGVLVFKTVLSDEFSQFGVQRSIEIKSLFVVNAENNSGKGLGSALMTKVIKEAERLNIGHAGIHVTVSETKEESLTFFKRKGFQIVHSWLGKYVRNTQEYLLFCPIEQLGGRAGIPRTPSMQNIASVVDKTHVAAQRVFGVQELYTVYNAHWDDVHSLMRLSDGTFISGSKDNSLCKWTKEGELVRVVLEPEPTATSERDWITATTTLNDRFWIHGDRNSRVCIWNTEGDYIRTVKPKLPKGDHKSLAFNTRRVNCLAKGLDENNPGFFIGFPTIFDEFSFFENRTVSSTVVHKNDWVFCIHPLDPRRLLTVVGGDLVLWEKPDKTWQKTKTLIQEGPRVRGKQRPFISKLQPLKSSPNLLVLGVFDGSVRLYDLEREKVVSQWTEHAGRVWDIAIVSEEVFASSGEDTAVKFWDVRENNAIHTIDGHVGQVTSLLHLDDHLLVAGTCPEAALSRNEGAQLVFYDARKS